mmetsp:Transcript_65878/g.176518  ORF Transcript_65878/g.176518 Transcript_65878/m.176518 type:complete len:205 (-) Transcript_65878:67-681(-)
MAQETQSRNLQIRKRTALSEKQVLDIYACKFADSPKSSQTERASWIASKYKINEKTVRDIWRGRTWKHITSTLAMKPSFKAALSAPVASSPKSVSSNTELETRLPFSTGVKSVDFPLDMQKLQQTFSPPMSSFGPQKLESLHSILNNIVSNLESNSVPSKMSVQLPPIARLLQTPAVMSPMEYLDLPFPSPTLMPRPWVDSPLR